MTGDYTRWYKTGSVNVTQNSKYVTGTNTNWNTAGLKPGDIFSVDDVKDYEIESITDNTHLVLVKPFAEATGNAKTYSIKRAFNATFGAQAAAQATELFGDVKAYIDGKQSTIRGKSAYELAVQDGYAGNEKQWIASLKGTPGTNGKSAYELAVQDGYTGTMDEWLESLKAAGEWSTLDNRTYPLTLPMAHANIYRGANLGSTFTDEQKSAISSGRFDNLYLGDRWQFPIDMTDALAELEDEGVTLDTYYTAEYAVKTICKLIILDFNYYKGQGIYKYNNNNDIDNSNHLLVMLNYLTQNKVFSNVWDFNTAPYYECKFREIMYRYALPIIEGFFGADHIKEFPCRLCNAYDANKKPVGWVNEWSKLELPSAMMCYGTFIDPVLDLGFDKKQARYWRNYQVSNEIVTCLRDVKSDGSGYHPFIYVSRPIYIANENYKLPVFCVK